MNVEISYDDASSLKKKHEAMKAWHANIAEQHSIAAEWHQNQAESLSKAMINVPLDPEKKVTTIPGRDTGSTSSSGGSAPSATEIPLDPVKKSDLEDILRQHEEEFGPLKQSIEEIVKHLLGE